MLMMMQHINNVQIPLATAILVFDLSIKTTYPFRAIDIMLDTVPTY
jgi:hypothetical protein